MTSKEPEQPTGQTAEQRHYACGCVSCVCLDEERCHGCGAKSCRDKSTCQWRRVVRVDAPDHPRSAPSVDLQKVRDELDNAAGCFNAAYSEGLLEKLAEETNTDVGSLHDLITRRVVYALEHIQNAAAILDSAGETKS